MTKNILVTSSIIALILLTAIAIGVNKEQEKPEENLSGFSQIILKQDIVGTGTTTAGTYNFGATAATTSITALNVTEEIDQIDFDIYPESASSSAHLGIQVLKSSLPNCGRTNGNLQHWVDASGETSASSHILSLNSATTTWQWSPATADASTGASFRITNFNAECMKVFIGGQSVNVYIQAIYRSLQSL